MLAPRKGIQDSLEFWIPRRGFRIQGTGFQPLSVELGFRIPIVSGIPDSLCCIPYSKAHDSRFPEKRAILRQRGRGWHKQMHKHKNIKSLRSFNAYVYVTALVISA